MTDDRRKRYRQYHQDHQTAFAAWAARGYRPPSPALPPMPADLRNLACGAKTRRGTPCKRTDLMINGRCKFHGGMSTGPRSIGGKERAKANLAKRWPSEPHEGFRNVQVDDDGAAS